MAKQTLQDAYIAINGTAYSDHGNSVTITDTADEIDFTSFGPAAYKSFGQGMRDATIDVNFFQDFASGSIHSVLQPIYAGGGTVNIEVRPTSGARSTTNPAALLVGRLYSYAGIAGKAGDALEVDCAFRNAGTAGLTWVTS